MTDGAFLGLVAGLGLLSMRERAEALGGSLGVATAPNEGTVITLELNCA